jgi:hypothetical protein
VSAVQVLTEEGPVIVEHWDDNSVVVSESFDTTMAAKLRSAARDAGSATRAQNYRQDELGLGLYEIPAFQKFQAEIGKRIAQELESSR